MSDNMNQVGNPDDKRYTINGISVEGSTLILYGCKVNKETSVIVEHIEIAIPETILNAIKNHCIEYIAD